MHTYIHASRRPEGARRDGADAVAGAVEGAEGICICIYIYIRIHIYIYREREMHICVCNGLLLLLLLLILGLCLVSSTTITANDY